VFAIAVVVVALFAYQGGLDGGTVVSPPDDDAGGSAGASDGADGTGDTDGTAVTEASNSGESAATAAASTTEGETTETDVELLSDEERVEHLLDQNGGRMRQADIVSETGWSDAKVSQLLSAMADEGRIDKLRLGRENLISFPDTDDLPADESGDEE
jgi:uncharacterized membrane protein